MPSAGRWRRPRNLSTLPPEELAKRGTNFLETEITDRIKKPARRVGRCTSLSPTPAIRPRTRPRRGLKIVAPSRLARSSVQQIEAEADGPVPRHQLRSDGPAKRHTDVRRSVPRLLAQPLTGSPMTAARPRRKTIREPRREHPNEQRSAAPPGARTSTLHASPASPPLVHGGVHSGDAVHRRRHGYDGRAGISDARRHPTSRSGFSS